MEYLELIHAQGHVVLVKRDSIMAMWPVSEKRTWIQLIGVKEPMPVKNPYDDLRAYFHNIITPKLGESKLAKEED